MRNTNKQQMKGSFAKGIAFALGLSFTALIAAPLNIFTTGESASSQKMNENFGKMSPVGTINAWHKSMTGTPTLPDGWVECNGQVIGDTESPYDGQTIPDLNGQARFLRGSSTSGSMQGDQFQGHHHREYISATNGQVGNTNVMVKRTNLTPLATEVLWTRISGKLLRTA